MGASKSIDLLLLVLTLCLAAGVASATSRQNDLGCSTTLPGDSATWTEQEHWTWKEICEGRPGNLDKYSTAAAEMPTGRTRQVDLSSRFLQTILLREPYRTIVANQGLQIIGARFGTPVDLRGLKASYSIALTRCSFSTLDLSYAKVGDELAIDEATVSERLKMRGLEVSRSLSMRRAILDARDEAVDLAGASIGDNLDLAMVTAKAGGLNMDSISVGGSLLLRGEGSIRSSFTSLWIVNGHIGGELDISDANVGTGDQAPGKEALRGDRAARGELKMNGLKVGNDIKVLNPYLFYVTLRNGTIDGNLMLEGPKGQRSSLRGVDLTGTTVGHTLSFGSDWYGPINWAVGASLSLANTSVTALLDGIGACDSAQSTPRLNTWPEQIQLNGFSLQRLATLDGNKEVDMAACPATWWIDWLGRQQHYSPEPYEMLAALFVKAGYKEKAKEILYAGKNAELSAAPYPEKIWLQLQKAFIGYGYYNFRALAWIAVFIMSGVVVLHVTGQGSKNNMPIGLAYSVDMLLPFLKLRDAHSKIELSGPAKYYFYLHKLMGFVLASFLVAGISGLTK